MKMKLAILLSLSLFIGTAATFAQDSASSPATPSEASPLTGLFTPPAKFQNGQDVVPTPGAGNGDNPYRGLWTPPPSHNNGATPNQPPPENTANQFKGLFTPSAEHQSGQRVESAPQVQSSVFLKNQIEKHGFEPTEAHKELIKTYDPTYFDKKGEGAEKDKEKAAQGGAGGGGKQDEGAKEAKDADGSDKSGTKPKTAKQKQRERERAKAKAKAAKEKEEKKEAPPAYNALQEVLFFINSGNYEQALAAVTQVLKAQPTNAKAHYVGAIVHVGRRDYANAKKEYYQVIQLAPASQLAQMAGEGLKKIGAPLPVPPKMPPLQVRP